MSSIQYKTVQVDSVKIFYREGGSPTLPALLLLHGHASASHTFRNILPHLSETFRVIAPDYPGFGNSDSPDPKTYTYTFANIANTIDKFTEQINLTKFSIYIFDYGAPIGLTLATKHPDRITAIFTQSGNAYKEGLASGWDAIKALWANPNDLTKEEPIKQLLSPQGIEQIYTIGTDPASRIGYDAIALDIYYTSRPGAFDIQAALFRDYENNILTYPIWQVYLRKYKPKIVGVWGRFDPFFSPAGAEAYRRDVPDADITIVDGGHFLVESHPEEIVAAVKKLL